MEQLQGKVRDMQQQEMASLQQNTALVEANETLQQQLDEALAQQLSNEQQMSHVEQEKQRLQEQMKDLEQQIQRYVKDAKKKGNDTNWYKGEMKKLNAQLDQLQKKHAMLHEQFEEKCEAAEKLSQQIKAVNKATREFMKIAETEMTALKEEIETLKLEKQAALDRYGMPEVTVLQGKASAKRPSSPETRKDKTGQKWRKVGDQIEEAVEDDPIPLPNVPWNEVPVPAKAAPKPAATPVKAAPARAPSSWLDAVTQQGCLVKAPPAVKAAPAAAPKGTAPKAAAPKPAAPAGPPAKAPHPQWSSDYAEWQENQKYIYIYSFADGIAASG